MTTEEAVQKVRDVVRLRHLSLATEESYTMWLRRFARKEGREPGRPVHWVKWQARHVRKAREAHQTLSK